MESITRIAKENFCNIDALWKWIRKECRRNNIESVELKTLIKDEPFDNSPCSLKYVSGRVLTIELGPELDYSNLDI